MQQEIDPKIKKRNNLYGLLIITAILLPMILAYVMFKTGWGVSGKTTNKGILLTEARSLKELVLRNNEDRLATLYDADKKQWRILVPVTAVCDKACENHLYLSRQVHIRLAEKAYRVERILLLLDELPPERLDSLKQDHPETVIVNSSTANLTTWLEPNKLSLSPENYFYLVDQEGFAMMRYGLEHTGQDLLDDIKKLLKFTYDK
jgi:cytochrome oxidase Cu insertion factor (SCO1/SenC/PrrC family)